jgi:ABC-type dipeptide/oligopeptide/nickel transport system permease component
VKTYIAQRLGIGLVTLFGMSVVIVLLLRLAPGNIVDILFSTGGYVNLSERAAIEHELGLDEPLWAPCELHAEKMALAVCGRHEDGLTRKSTSPV